MSAQPSGTRVIAALAAAASIVACGVPIPESRGLVRVGDDLIGAHGELTVEQDVPGDVMVAAGNITFTGSARDYIGAGGQQTIGGRIDGAARAAGGQLLVDAQIGRNATLAGGELQLRPGSAIDGNAYLSGGRVVVAGRIGDNLRVAAGDVVVRGEIGGDVTIEAGTLSIESGARIGGNLRYRAQQGRATIHPDATILGETTVLPPRPPSRIPALLRFIWLGGFLVAGGALVLLLGRTSGAAADAIGLSPAASLGFGLLWLIAVPFAAAILAITVIGVPLAIIIGLAYIVSLFLARTIPALWLGRMLLRGRVSSEPYSDLLAFLVGAIILLVVQLIPYVGALVFVIATIFGLGAFALALWAGERIGERSAPEA